MARPAHLGNTTQVWDAVVTRHADDRTIALFRCTQLILWPKA
jgi:acyl-coenzyme A thioesterase PaaI-like protein